MRRPTYDVPEWGDASGNNHEYQVEKILSLSIYWSWNAKTKTAYKHKICPKIFDENHPIAEHDGVTTPDKQVNKEYISNNYASTTLPAWV